MAIDTGSAPTTATGTTIGCTSAGLVMPCGVATRAAAVQESASLLKRARSCSTSCTASRRPRRPTSLSGGTAKRENAAPAVRRSTAGRP